MKSVNDLQSTIKEYLEKKREGMDYTQIRKDLSEKQIEDSDIKKIVQEIDDRILAEEFEKSGKSASEKMQIGGWFFTAVGIIFTLGRYTNITFFHENYLLSYGSLIVGLTLLFYGYFKKRISKQKNDEPFSRFKKQ